MTVRTMVNPGSRLCAFVRWVEFASPLLLVLYFLTFSSEMKGQRRWWGCSSSLCRSSAFLSPHFFGSQSPLLSVSPVFLVSPALRGFFFSPVLGLLFPQFSPGFFSLSAWLFRVPSVSFFPLFVALFCLFPLSVSWIFFALFSSLFLCFIESDRW
jgi:hypothetical protein